MKLRSACLLGAVAIAALRCQVYDDDALAGGDGGRASSSPTASSANASSADASSANASSSDATSGPTSTTDAASSSAQNGSTAPATSSVDASSADASTTANTTATTAASTTAAASSSTGIVMGTAWINELHYDNAAADMGEGVEIAGTAGLDLTGWTVVSYNGSNGTVSAAGGTVTLSGTLPNQMAGKGTRWFDVPGLENGPNDGIALVDDAGQVVQFLAYEGGFTATAGPAVGMMAVNLPVSEEPAPAAGVSLQLTGAGSAYADFTWVANVASSHDAINAGQTLQ